MKLIKVAAKPQNFIVIDFGEVESTDWKNQVKAQCRNLNFMTGATMLSFCVNQAETTFTNNLRAAWFDSKTMSQSLSEWGAPFVIERDEQILFNGMKTPYIFRVKTTAPSENRGLSLSTMNAAEGDSAVYFVYGCVWGATIDSWGNKCQLLYNDKVLTNFLGYGIYNLSKNGATHGNVCSFTCFGHCIAVQGEVKKDKWMLIHVSIIGESDKTLNNVHVDLSKVVLGTYNTFQSIEYLNSDGTQYNLEEVNIIDITQPDDAEIQYSDFKPLESSILYFNHSDKNHVTKELEIVDTFDMTLNEPTNAIDPTIMIRTNAIPDIITRANYMYIAAFNRFYYITDIQIVRTGLIRITGHVDVLMTYATLIREQEGIVSRQEFQYNLYGDDEEFKFDARPIIKTQKFTKYKPIAKEGEGGPILTPSFAVTIAGGEDAQN